MGAVGILLLALLGAAILLDGSGPLSRAGLALGVAGIAALVVWRGGLRAARPDALRAVVIWSALAGLQLLWAETFDAALDGAAGVLCAGTIFLIAGVALPREEHRRWLVAFGLLGALVAIAAIVGRDSGGHASTPFGNPNRLAAWLLLPAAPAFVGVWCGMPRQRRLGWSLLWVGVLTLCAAGLVVSRSLGGGLAAVGAAVALAWMSLTPRRLGLGSVVALTGATALGLVLLPVAAPDWVPWVRNGSEFSPGIRWQIYAAAARSALDTAPLGTGLGGFADAFAGQRPEFLPYAPRHAHNEPLHALVELGLPFLLALAASFFLALRGRDALPGTRRSFAGWCGLAAGVAVAAHSLVDAPLGVPAVVLGLAVLVGMACAPEEGERAHPVDATRLALVSLSLALAGLGGTGAVASLAERNARVALDEGRFERAAHVARQGLLARSASVALWRVLAEAEEHQALLADGGPRALASAVGSRRRAVEAAPRSAARRIDLARAKLRVGDRSGALLDLAMASRLDPASPRPHLARARALLAQGELEAAAGSAREALVRHPLATRPVVRELLRLTGDPELALSALPLESAAFARAGRELDRAGYGAAAARALERSLRLDPGNARVALESARIWRRAGRPARAAAVLSRALAVAPADPDLRRELAQTRARGRGGAS